MRYDHNSSLQRDHPLVPTSGFDNMEEYVGYLIHRMAYEEAVRMANGKPVLDWGCNNGYGLEIMRNLGCQNISGIDTSPSAIAAARDRLGADVPLYLFDGGQAPLPADSVPVITSFQCIEHVVDRDGFLQEIRRLLSPGGILLMTTPNAAIRLDPGMKPWNEYHVTEFWPSQLLELTQEHFGDVDLRGLFGVHRLHQIEVTRCARARASARGRGFSALLRRVTPMALKRLLKRHTDSGTRPSAEFTTADFHYRNDDLDSALDLMAVCTKR
jgi:SAM-dependent methyltransferase